jgi:two-component system sensor histidine kinase QseC
MRMRLLIAIGASFALFWTMSSVFTLVNLRGEFRDALDERLAASATMVAALIADAPQLALRGGAPPAGVVPALSDTASVACEISLYRGGVIGKTSNSPARLGAVTPGFHTRTIDGVTWRSYTIEKHGFRITTADRVERRQQLFRNIAMATFVPFIVAMFATLAALGLAIRVGLRPLERIRHALASRDPDTLHPLEAQRLPQELLPLVSTVNGLLATVERAIARERRFTGDAAHELRTPLTAVKTHLQVARMSVDPAGIATALEHAEHGVRRLQSTIDQLLVLARVEGAAAFADDERLDAGAIAQHAIAQLPPAQAQRVRIRNDAGSAVPRLPSALAVTALRNILDNAFRHGSHVDDVLLDLVAANGRVLFIVTDDGPGISEDDLAKARQRFWRKGSGHGSGLGLSIVEAIAARYGGSLSLARSVSRGLRVEIAFPAL